MAVFLREKREPGRRALRRPGSVHDYASEVLLKKTSPSASAL
jgi:hypothetical protein